MNRKLALLCLIVPIAFGIIRAQSPTIVVQAASPVPIAATSATPPAAADSKSLSPLIKLLQEMKATNEETLKKQQAALQQLDDLQKAAEQLKTFGKRG
jgi:hypothetical protein